MLVSKNKGDVESIFGFLVKGPHGEEIICIV